MKKHLSGFTLGVLFFGAVTAQPVAPSVVMGRKEVPILCYHQVRDWKATDSKVSRDYIMPPADLRAELKMLHDSGYHTILPDELYAYLTKGGWFSSKKWKWRRKYKRAIKVRENNNYHMTEFHFFDKQEEEIKL